MFLAYINYYCFPLKRDLHLAVSGEKSKICIFIFSCENANPMAKNDRIPLHSQNQTVGDCHAQKSTLAVFITELIQLHVFVGRCDAQITDG